MSIGYGERIDLENDFGFANIGRLLALEYAWQIYKGEITAGDKEQVLALHLIKNCTTNPLVSEMNKLMVGNIDRIFPDVDSKQELIQRLYGGELISNYRQAIIDNWLDFADLFLPGSTNNQSEINLL